jgi:hypothetical protein
MKLEKTNDGKTVLMWKSNVVGTVACRVTEMGFEFSRVCSYDIKKRRINSPIRFRFDIGNVKRTRFQEEVETMKQIFSSYSMTAKDYLI